MEERLQKVRRLLFGSMATVPIHFGAHYNLGTALAFLGKKVEVIAEFTKALSEKPNLLEARKKL
jgi:hypothetical protein